LFAATGLAAAGIPDLLRGKRGLLDESAKVQMSLPEREFEVVADGADRDAQLSG